MASIIRKLQTLFSANMHGMIDRALETNSLKVMDEYIRQVERNLDALEDSAATVGGSVRTLKRKYEEFSNQADKLDRDIDTLILRGKDDLAAAAQAELNTKQELAQEYYEQWQSQEGQYQGMMNMRMKLEGRLTTIKQEREKMRSLLELAETKKVMTKTLKSMDKLDTSWRSGNRQPAGFHLCPDRPGRCPRRNGKPQTFRPNRRHRWHRSGGIAVGRAQTAPARQQLTQARPDARLMNRIYAMRRLCLRFHCQAITIMVR